LLMQVILLAGRYGTRPERPAGMSELERLRGDETIMNMNMGKTLFEEMVAATVAMDEERCVSLARKAVNEGVDPFEAIQNGFARGMQIVGDKFAKLECFLPEVMLSADAMNAAVEVLKPHLVQRVDRGSQGTIVIGTIQGDVHDLGKSIVKIMLEAAGFTVHDLGNDAPVRQFVEKAQEVGADIIAASALMTTTMAHMPDIDGMLKELGIRDKYYVMLGGAPVIAEWAGEVGADGYGEDAAEAVETAKRLLQKKMRR
jgi:corrinoid protein of di/trimethylamine methyltransferase